MVNSHCALYRKSRRKFINLLAACAVRIHTVQGPLTIICGAQRRTCFFGLISGREGYHSVGLEAQCI